MLKIHQKTQKKSLDEDVLNAVTRSAKLDGPCELELSSELLHDRFDYGLDLFLLLLLLLLHPISMLLRDALALAFGTLQLWLCLWLLAP